MAGEYTLRLLVSAGDADTAATANSVSATLNIDGHYSINAVFSEDDGNDLTVAPEPAHLQPEEEGCTCPSPLDSCGATV